MIDRIFIDEMASDIMAECAKLPEAEMNAKLKETFMKVYSERLLPEIAGKSGAVASESEDEILFGISGTVGIVSAADYYIPENTKVSVKYERLALTALVGALLFGILFYVFLGGIFADRFYAPLAGMPIGSALLVWLFAKAARHPKIAAVIKWGSVAGFAGISIAAVFSNLKGGFFGKKGINFLQWLFMAVMTLLVFWMIHMFKPVTEDDSKSLEAAVKEQLRQRIISAACLTETYISSGNTVKDENSCQDSGKISSNSGGADPVTDGKFFSGKFLSPVLSQMLRCIELDDGKMALSSVQSYVNGLHAMGIRPLEKNGKFVFEIPDEDFFDTFGIVNPGDTVETLVNAWEDADGNPAVRGMVRKVRS